MLQRGSPISALGLVVALLGLAALARSAPVAPPDARPPVPRPAIPIGPVDVNRASADELTTLPRIGPTLAARIVEDRATRGPFASLDDLDRVPGLGPSTIEELRAHAVAGPILAAP